MQNMQIRTNQAMMNAARRGKPDAGNPHLRFDEGEVALATTPRRGSLLYKQIFGCLVLGLSATMSASAGSWQSVDGSWNGSFSDSRHWNGGFAYNNGVNEISSASAPGAVTVTVDAATETTGRLTLTGMADRPAILDVTGESLLFATQTVDGVTWDANAFYGKFNGYTFFKHNSGDSRWNRQAQAKFTDVAVKIWSPEAGVAEMRVTGGTSGGVFDFVHPDPRGDTKAPNGARPSVTLFEADYYTPSYSDFNQCNLTFVNTTAYLPSFTIASRPRVGEILLSGSDLSIYGTLSANCVSNVFSLTSGSALNVVEGSWAAQSSGAATTIVRMEADCVFNTKGMSLSSDRHVIISGGRVLPAVVDFMTATDNAIFDLKNTSLYRNAENRFTLSGNSRLQIENSALTNTVKFTVKTTDSAKIEQKGGSLVTPLVAGGDSSRIELEDVDVVVDNWGLSNSRVQMKDCIFLPDGGFAVSGMDGEYLMTNVTGVTSTSKPFYISGSNVVTFTADSPDRKLVVNSDGHGKIGSGPYGEFNLEGGTFEFRGKTAASRLCLGHDASGNVGVLNVKGGRLVSKVTIDGTTRAFGLGITHGTGFINVSGGELDVSGLCICTEDNTNGKESVFRQTGGLVKVAACNYEANCQSYGLCATGNGKKTRRARIALDGGVTEASVIAGGTSGQCRGGTGWTAFEADGGTVKVNKDGALILRDFDEAKLGAKGLTVDANGNSLTIAQNLTSQADVTGRLVLTGVGTKTVSGTNAVEIVANGGETAFAAGSDNSNVSLVVTNGATVSFASSGAKNRTFASLVLGGESSQALVNLKAGEPLTVTGDVTVKHLSLYLSGSFTTGQSYSLLTCGGTISEDSKTAWRKAVANGLGADQGCDFVFENDGLGNTTLKMAVRERADLTITVDAGATSNVAEAVEYSVVDTLTADVGAEGTLNVTGRTGWGALVKTGVGCATFDNAADFFAGGATVQAGLLTFPEAAIFADPATRGSALTVGTGTLELGRAGAAPVMLEPSLVINTSVAADAAVVKCASDVTVTAPTVTQGCFVKCGAGTLTLEASGPCAFSSNAGKDVKGSAPHATALSFDPFGVPPTDNYSALTVAEGDLVLKGVGGVKYTTSGSGAVYVGMPVQGIEKPARLVVDGAEAEFKGSHFHVGSGVKTTNCSQPYPEFVVTNGAAVTVTSLRLGWNKDPTARPRVCVSGPSSSLYATEYFYLADSSSSGLSESDPLLLATDGASVLMPSMTDGNINHALVMNYGGIGVFDGALLAAKDKAEARVRASGNGSIVFKNGAECRVAEVSVGSDSASLNLTFDDASWSFGAKTELTLTRPERVTVTARNKGIAFAPQAGTNMTFGLAISGSGDLVKRGAGTLTLDAAPTLTGVCRVEEGALALGSGVVAANMTLAGAGSLTAGTFADTTIYAPLGDSGAVTGAVPVIAGATFTGRTFVDLARTTPLERPFPHNIRVATYTGPAPDVSQWKVVNSATKRLLATFVAVNGEILMDLQATGLIIIYR